MTDTIELRPCPFCGERIDPPRSRQSSADRSEGFVAFAVCYCGGYSMTAHQMGSGVTEIEAIRDAAAKWNNRAQPASVPDEVRRDAERYRWLRDEALNMAGFAPAAVVTDGCIVQQCLDGRDLDEEIDAAMAAKEVKQ